jgi:hypothetical protein
VVEMTLSTADATPTPEQTVAFMVDAVTPSPRAPATCALWHSGTPATSDARYASRMNS